MPSASYITSVAVSPTGSYVAFGDADGMINLLTAAEDDVDTPFNGFEGHPVEWADPPDEVPVNEWSEITCVKCTYIARRMTNFRIAHSILLVCRTTIPNYYLPGHPNFYLSVS